MVPTMSLDALRHQGVAILNDNDIDDGMMIMTMTTMTMTK